MEGFFDTEKFQKLAERIRQTYLELGLTVMHQAAQVDENGDLVLITAAIVRDTAYNQITQDAETRKEFSKQMAADADARLEARMEAISKAMEEGRILEVLMGNQPLVQCSHERIHEGLCLDCQQEVPDE